MALSQFQKKIIFVHGLTGLALLFLIIASAGGEWSTASIGSSDFSFGLSGVSSKAGDADYKGDVKNDGNAASAFLAFSIINLLLVQATLLNVFPLNGRIPKINDFMHIIGAPLVILAMLPWAIWIGAGQSDIESSKSNGVALFKDKVEVGYCSVLSIMAWLLCIVIAGLCFVLKKDPEMDNTAGKDGLLPSEDSADGTYGTV